MAKKRVHVWVSGRVQRVFYRSYTKDAGTKEGVTGWVQNLPDGRVEAVFEGEAEKVDRMVQWCYEGSPLSHVDRVEVREEPFTGAFEHFEITYGRQGNTEL